MVFCSFLPTTIRTSEPEEDFPQGLNMLVLLSERDFVDLSNKGQGQRR